MGPLVRWRGGALPFAAHFRIDGQPLVSPCTEDYGAHLGRLEEMHVTLCPIAILSKFPSECRKNRSLGEGAELHEAGGLEKHGLGFTLEARHH